jgi:hypothetical protein
LDAYVEHIDIRDQKAADTSNVSDDEILVVALDMALYEIVRPLSVVGQDDN